MANLNTKTLSAGVGDILCVDGGISGDKQIIDGDGTTSNLYIDGTNLGIGISAPTKPLQVSGDATLTATGKLFLDGGTHTYIHESGDDQLDIVVGTTTLLTLDENGGSGNDIVSIPTNTKFQIGGADTYFIENPSDHLVLKVGDAQMMMWDQDETGGGNGTISFGVDGDGCDLKLYSETAGKYFHYDQGTSDLVLYGGTIRSGGSSASNVTTDGTITTGDMYVDIDANGSARTGLRFSGGGTTGALMIVKNSGGEPISFHNTEGTALLRGVSADHDTMEAGFLGLFISDGTYWNLISGGIDTQPDIGLTAS